jgi:hypothetical protein
MCESGIFVGGFLENWQDTNSDLMYRGNWGGYLKNGLLLPSLDRIEQGSSPPVGSEQWLFRWLWHEGCGRRGTTKRSPRGTRRGTHRSRGRAEDGRRRRAEAPVVAHGGGGVMVIDWRRWGAEEVQHVHVNLMEASSWPGRQWRRRIVLRQQARRLGPRRRRWH